MVVLVAGGTDEHDRQPVLCTGKCKRTSSRFESVFFLFCMWAVYHLVHLYSKSTFKISERPKAKKISEGQFVAHCPVTTKLALYQ